MTLFELSWQRCPQARKYKSSPILDENVTLWIPMKKLINQTLLIVKKRYKMILSKNIYKCFFKPSNEIKTSG